jgi:hypothetical protein
VNDKNTDHSVEGKLVTVENSTSNYTDTDISATDPGLLIPSNMDPGLLIPSNMDPGLLIPSNMDPGLSIPSEESLEIESSDSRTRIRISRPRKGPGAR